MNKRIGLFSTDNALVNAGIRREMSGCLSREEKFDYLGFIRNLDRVEIRNLRGG